MKSILVLINRRSRSGERFYEEVIARLESTHHHIIKLSEEEGETDPNQLIEKHRDQIDYVLVGGGDGSVNRVLPSLVKTQIPLLVLPLGTANNLARTYGLLPRAEDVISLIDSGQIVSIDLGSVNGIYFVNVAGMGLSTKINRVVPPWFKRYFGVFAFIFTAFQVLRRARPFKAMIETDSTRVQSLSWQISVCNGRYYGSGLTIKDNATLVDQKLHCLSTEITHWWKSFLLVPAFLKGKYSRNDDVTLLSGQTIQIKTKKPLKIDVDGDIQTSTPAEFRVHARILKIVIPPGQNPAGPEGASPASRGP